MDYSRRYNLFARRVCVNDEIKPSEWAEDGFVFYRNGWCQDIDVFKPERRKVLDAFIDDVEKLYKGR